jgi:heme/copper-type cytochrome/quinol oxidase subunit 3
LPDNLLLIIFGALSTLALAFAALCLVFAVKSAKKKDAEVQMALWSFGALAGFTFAGMCWAYFLIPILANKLF